MQARTGHSVVLVLAARTTARARTRRHVHERRTNHTGSNVPPLGRLRGRGPGRAHRRGAAVCRRPGSVAHRAVDSGGRAARLPDRATDGAPGLAGAGTRKPRGRPRAGTVHPGELGRGPRPGGGRTAAGARLVRQLGDLRRLLRLGLRGAVPPRPESTAPLHEPVRRIRPLGQRLQLRRRGSHRPSCLRVRLGGHSRGRHLLAGDRQAFAARGQFRGTPAQEHPGQRRRHRQARRPRLARALQEERRRVRERQPGPGRRRGFPRSGMAGAAPQHRHRADAGAGPHAGPRGPPRPGIPGQVLHRLRELSRLPRG